MAGLAVIDTHALLWAATGQRRRLGRRALRFLERVDQREASVYVPTIALVEVGEAACRGRVALEGGFARWVERLLATGHFVSVDLTAAVALRAQGLYYSIPERGDRLIAATASVLDVPLLTRDPAIAKAAAVDLLW